MEQLAKHQDEYAGGLRALGHDLDSSIRGERLNFIGAMENATSMKLEGESHPFATPLSPHQPPPPPALVLTPGHTRDFLAKLNDDVSSAATSMKDLHAERMRVQEDVAEMMGFMLKHAKKSGIPMDTFPPQMQDSLKRYAGAIASPDAPSSPPGRRPLPQPPSPLR